MLHILRNFHHRALRDTLHQVEFPHKQHRIKRMELVLQVTNTPNVRPDNLAVASKTHSMSPRGINLIGIFVLILHVRMMDL